MRKFGSTIHFSPSLLMLHAITQTMAEPLTNGLVCIAPPPPQRTALLFSQVNLTVAGAYLVFGISICTCWSFCCECPLIHNPDVLICTNPTSHFLSYKVFVDINSCCCLMYLPMFVCWEIVF
jgi:hypothetical protein